jgi:uncharacterized protein YbjT (DUF2867 family)
MEAIMKIAVIGGSVLIGSRVVTKLREHENNKEKRACI